MDGLQFSSMNFKNTNQHVSNATLRLLNVYQERNHVSDVSLKTLLDEILVESDDAYKLANSSPRTDKHTPDHIEAEYKRFLAARGLTATKVNIVSSRSVSSPQLETRPPAEIIDIPLPVRGRGRARKLRPMVNGHELPKKVTSIEETITLKWIICLEDGKKVKDLSHHLVSFGLTPSQYRKKWGLPDSYPMHAPQLILQRGATFEVDYMTGLRRRVRS